MVRSIASALLLFASATSYEAETEPVVEKYGGYVANEQYYGNADNQKDYGFPDLKTEESDFPNSKEYERFEDEQNEDMKEEKNLAACIEWCPIPCEVQEIFRAKYVDDVGKPLTTEDLEKMCNDIEEAIPGEAKEIYEELKTLFPELEAEILAFGLNVLEGKVDLAKEVLKYAVMGEKIWEQVKENITETAEPLVSTSTSSPTEADKLELSLPKVAITLPRVAVEDTTKEEFATKATQYDAAEPVVPTFTTTTTESYKPIHTFEKHALPKKATFAGVPAQAKGTAYSYSAPIGHRYHAPAKNVIQAQIPKYLPVVTTKAPIVPSYSTYENNGERLTEPKPFKEYSYTTRGRYAPLGHRAAASTNQYWAPYTADVDANTVSRPETRPLTPVAPWYEDKSNVPDFDQTEFNYPAETHPYNGGH